VRDDAVRGDGGAVAFVVEFVVGVRGCHEVEEGHADCGCGCVGSGETVDGVVSVGVTEDFVAMNAYIASRDSSATCCKLQPCWISDCIISCLYSFSGPNLREIKSRATLARNQSPAQ
jgi:hypothetical protein